MPLIELKTLKPICDTCGKVGSTWANVESGQEAKAIPDGWMLRSKRVSRNGREWLEIVCDECRPRLEVTIGPPPENDSRA